MKAVYFEKHGGPEVLQVGEVPEPQPGHGEVAIDVVATSLNHLDLLVRRGLPGMKLPLPHVPGSDAAGRIARLGDGVDGVAVGDRVAVDPSLTCGHCEFCVRGDAPMCRRFRVLGEHVWGGCAETVVVPAANVVRIPDHVSFSDAASFPMVFSTAWRMLVSRGRLRAGEDVLILGAAAGVGIACIQIAKLSGAHVLAAAGSTEKLDLCRELGADVLINYNEEDVVKRVRAETGKRGVDVCVDYVGQDTWPKSLATLARGGRLLTCGATTGPEGLTDIRFVFYKQLEIIGSTTGNHNEMRVPLELMFEGKLKPVVGRTFDLEHTADAHRLMEERKVLGKVIIQVGKE